MNEEELKQLSRKVQEFKLSEHYSILSDKLASDYKKLVNNLIIGEDLMARGAINYLLSLYDWFNSKAELEELINIEKRKITEDKDW